VNKSVSQSLKNKSQKSLKRSLVKHAAEADQVKLKKVFSKKTFEFQPKEIFSSKNSL
jgi:hypothetical protein